MTTALGDPVQTAPTAGKIAHTIRRIETLTQVGELTALIYQATQERGK